MGLEHQPGSRFDLLLASAIQADVKPEEMPAVLYVISDMEFNCAVLDPDKTVYESTRAQLEAHRYPMPAMVFQNVNSWQMQAPVTAHTQGTPLVSGAAATAMEEKFNGNVTPIVFPLYGLFDFIHACTHTNFR